MILDTIILENFGAYVGRQEAKLTPLPGKPIVLFGGLNGGGKTTLLDAIQLAFYGDKARISNRGRRTYKDYLLQSIHRGCDPSEGAGVIIKFRRMVDGESRHFELSRLWRLGNKGIEETVRVLRDAMLDDVFTGHWDEVIDAYLPSSIAHLFFFDGEQIMELAEGGHAAEILGTAVHSLLGLDLVDRLETDLKVFERRKRAEGLDEIALERLSQLRREIDQIDREQERLAGEEGVLVNQAGRLAKDVVSNEVGFKAEGGDFFQKRVSLEGELEKVKNQRAALESEFRTVVAGPLPLGLIEPLLREVEAQVRHEVAIRQAKSLVGALEERDARIVALLGEETIPTGAVEQLQRILTRDRDQRRKVAEENLLLDAPEELVPQITHLCNSVLPPAKAQAARLEADLATSDEHLARIEAELARVPPAERIASLQAALDAARNAHAEKMSELEKLRSQKELLRRRRADAEMRLDKMGVEEIEVQLATDDRRRMLKHSAKARSTLDLFRTKIVKQHVGNMETLMLEAFQSLLRKAELVKGLTINPDSFEPTLTGCDGNMLPFDRLSAGERQLLATSMLWGLAQASGRPVPTVIDTPLGRLDSDHRTNLIERYFPNASHQVLLLSTNEEIVGGYFKALKPYISRTYMLAYDAKLGATRIEEGYFA